VNAEIGVIERHVAHQCQPRESLPESQLRGAPVATLRQLPLILRKTPLIAHPLNLEQSPDSASAPPSTAVTSDCPPDISLSTGVCSAGFTPESQDLGRAFWTSPNRSRP